MKDIKKVTLIGLGAMGVFFAPRISEKLGADFRILADGARKERLERKGVTVNTINYRFPIITPDVEGDPADLVIIAVKGYDLEQAIRDITIRTTLIKIFCIIMLFCLFCSVTRFFSIFFSKLST